MTLETKHRLYDHIGELLALAFIGGLEYVIVYAIAYINTIQ